MSKVEPLRYIKSKPGPSAQLIGLSALAVAGLLALWLAAFAAFSNIASWPQAAAASTLIEAGLIIEALAWMRWRSQFALTGLIASLLVSGTYNYLQADQAAEISLWPLLALALGPLVALATVALALGDALTQYQLSIDKWEAERSVWTAARQTELDAEEARQQQRREDAEDEERGYRRKQDELARKRAEKRKTKSKPKVTESYRQPSATLPETVAAFPETLAAFREAVAEGAVSPDELTGKEIERLTEGTVKERTARNWLKPYRQAANGAGQE